MKNYVVRIVILLSMAGVLSGCWLTDLNNKFITQLVPSLDKNNEVLLGEAQALFEQKKAGFSASEWEKGPCLGKLNDDWVVDVAHSPRQAVDDDLANQCQDYYNDKAKHFIELDLTGKLITMK